jgi:hypothetical protein
MKWNDASQQGCDNDSALDRHFGFSFIGSAWITNHMWDSYDMTAPSATGITSPDHRRTR